MSTYTCLSCHVAFASGDGQRDHFRSDWHRYNLMRKVADLPPVTRETYNERVGQAQSLGNQVGDGKKIACQPCKKAFANQNAYDNHIKSKRHMESVLSSMEDTKNRKNKKHQKKVAEEEEEVEEDMEVEEVDSDEWEGEAVELLDCLFCSLHLDTVEAELLHMTEKHSFFIPDMEFCVDVPGLLTYLGEKIGCGYECLGCKWTARRNPTVESVRRHMSDKCHNMLVLEGDGLLEYADFYDYSSSYPDAGEATEDDEVDLNVLSGDGYELVLPSGATVGHRSLHRYYKQKLDPNRRAIVLKKKPGEVFHSVMAKYRSLGWNGATKADIVRKHRDLHFMTKMQAKQNTRLGTKANKLFVMRQQNPI